MTRIDDLFERQEYDVNIFPNLTMVWAGPPPSADIRVNLRYPGDVLSFVAECLRDDQGPEELASSNALLSHFQHFIATQAHTEDYPTEPFRQTMEYLSRTDLMIRCGHTLSVRVMATIAGSGPASHKAGLLDEEYDLEIVWDKSGLYIDGIPDFTGYVWWQAWKFGETYRGEGVTPNRQRETIHFLVKDSNDDGYQRVLPEGDASIGEWRWSVIPEVWRLVETTSSDS
ncbi:hypothetical protein PV10_08217 [Exophiala mesophila]|uniref:Uncharacterized protein n=1 Tax=Exophiala mesophila TaxID=212818 RepID=A0A0D1Z1B8_EXOME|nr:uncharacterized protein PV10_08217 [Exophiala mesophila]KIV88542.1 hypothetical protein PV10_08217 [Exophiala mesophila]